MPGPEAGPVTGPAPGGGLAGPRAPWLAGPQTGLRPGITGPGTVSAGLPGGTVPAAAAPGKLSGDQETFIRGYPSEQDIVRLCLRGGIDIVRK